MLRLPIPEDLMLPYEVNIWCKTAAGVSDRGIGVLKVIWAYDESSKKIHAMTVMPGITTTFVLWKKSDRVFGWRATGGGLSGSGEHRYSADGKTMTLVGTGLKLDGESMDDLNDVYHKVSP